MHNSNTKDKGTRLWKKYGDAAMKTLARVSHYYKIQPCFQDELHLAMIEKFFICVEENKNEKDFGTYLHICLNNFLCTKAKRIAKQQRTVLRITETQEHQEEGDNFLENIHNSDSEIRKRHFLERFEDCTWREQHIVNLCLNPPKKLLNDIHIGQKSVAHTNFSGALVRYLKNEGWKPQTITKIFQKLSERLKD